MIQVCRLLHPIIIGIGAVILTSSCAGHRQHQEAYAYQELLGARWEPWKTYVYPLLFTERGEQQRAELILRLDSRLNRGQARLQTRLSQRGEVLRRDTLTLLFAPEQGRWRIPGVVYHDYTADLARPLFVPRVGLYQLEVTLLDSLPLEGITQLGLRLEHAYPSGEESQTLTHHVDNE